MADHFYSVVKGDGISPANVTVGTSTSSEAMELRTRDGQGLTQMDVVQGLEAIKAYIETHAVTP